MCPNCTTRLDESVLIYSKVLISDGNSVESGVLAWLELWVGDVPIPEVNGVWELALICNGADTTIGSDSGIVRERCK